MENITVVTFIEKRMQQHGISLDALQEDLGTLGKPELQLIMRGVAKLPTRVIPAMARCLHSEPAELLQIAMTEYMPTTWNTLVEIWPCISGSGITDHGSRDHQHE